LNGIVHHQSRIMKSYFILAGLLFSASIQSCSQNTRSSSLIGGGCEGCVVVNKSPVPFSELSWIDTLPDFNEPGPKMVISGIVYKADGKTPAQDVVLYIYHTDQTGHYINRYNEEGWPGRQGYIKGWMKTNEKGQYKFYTLKPVAYPERNAPAHIHPVIKEAGKNEYYIDEYLFDDDPLLTLKERNKQEQRAGSGIIQLHEANGMLEGKRDIILGLHIPNYPESKN
jgi:protocatechuate 3,4-dioxygenase, beta subunit